MHDMRFLPATKETFLFSLPVIGARVVSTIGGFIAMLLIAMLGHDQIAAGALISSISMMIYVVGWSALFSITVVASRYVGESRTDELGGIIRQGWILGTLVGIPMMFVFFSIHPILHFLQQPERLIVLVTPYFHILAWGVLPGMWCVCFLQFVTGISKPKVALYVSLINVASMTIIGYCLLFGKFGLPKLGMAGMAYANVIASVIAFFAGLLYLGCSSHCKMFRIFSFSQCTTKEGVQRLRKLFDIGYPISLQYASELTAFAFSSIMIGWLGVSALAAQQVVLQLGYVVIMGPYGISHTCSVLVGQSLGKGDKAYTRALSQSAILLATVFMTLIAIIYYTFPDALIGLFSIKSYKPAYADTAHIATWLLAVAAVTQIFDAIRNVATGALRGFQDTKVPMIIGFVVSWCISVPAGYIMAFWWHWGAPGIQAGFLLGWALGAILLLRRLHKKTSMLPNNA